MAKLPKSIIKKYGISKKAWEVFKGKKTTRVKAKYKKTKVYNMAKRKKYSKKSFSKKSGFSFGNVFKILAGAAIAAAYEVFISPMIPLTQFTKNIVELILGIVLMAMPRMPMAVKAAGAALATINAYALVYPLISGMNGTSPQQQSAISTQEW